ncbi:Phosphatidylinositol 3,5-bisphosphate-binding protein [Spiromyces aspiralis]|uniref:Phosphatidylinositol 3,5-bisphosphate-binding protein n=1 Tax=Spiromyces aspiralis TaxID=68401 RepID=A0ACC1HFP5_9FUNG|nr:Phosphatidylinositol 3,5-bisphosphate-binding protein [Spiromyces aspiralis]
MDLSQRPAHYSTATTSDGRRRHRSDSSSSNPNATYIIGGRDGAEGDHRRIMSVSSPAEGRDVRHGYSQPSLSPHRQRGGNRLLFVDFNQDYGCFAVGTESGFRIYNSDPFKEKKVREVESNSVSGGIGIVSMLYRTNYLALVGGGRNPQFPPNRVMLWNDAAGQVMAELEFLSTVQRVLMKRHHIVVLLRNKCVICSMEARPRKLHAFDTYDNDRGAGAVNCDEDTNILVFPGRQKGHIQIVDLDSVVVMGSSAVVQSARNRTARLSKRRWAAQQQQQQQQQQRLPLRRGSGGDGGQEEHGVEDYGGGASEASIGDYREGEDDDDDEGGEEEIVRLSNINIIPAHSTAITALAVSPSGSRVASASEKGTLIRVFNTVNGQLLHEFRRGVDRAEIYSIAFSPDSTRLCVASDKGTVHVFNLEYGSQSRNGGDYIDSSFGSATSTAGLSRLSPSGNRRSALSFMKELLPKYFSSEWSFTRFRVPGEVRCICGFGQERNSVIVLCADGTCQKYTFDTFRGHSTREWTRRFI